MREGDRGGVPDVSALDHFGAARLAEPKRLTENFRRFGTGNDTLAPSSDFSAPIFNCFLNSILRCFTFSSPSVSSDKAGLHNKQKQETKQKQTTKIICFKCGVLTKTTLFQLFLYLIIFIDYMDV